MLCGLGSIGSCHLKNLQKLGFEDLIVFTTNSNPHFKVPSGINCFNDLEDTLQQRPFISIICNPTSLHIETAIKCAKAGSHIFIEKPISNNFNDLVELKEILKSNNLFCMIGYMMRFNPAIKLIKEYIKNGRLGVPIHFSSVWGEYLPNWHPYEDYRKSYAGSIKLGGGPILTLSHDIDIAYWFFGMPKRISCFTSNEPTLSIYTETIADIILKYDDKLTAHIHLNYIDEPPNRLIKVRFSNGQIEYDIINNKLTLYKGFLSQIKIKEFDYKDKFTRNDLFEWELSYFIKSVSKKIKPKPSIEDGINVLKLAIVAKESASELSVKHI